MFDVQVHCGFEAELAFPCAAEPADIISAPALVMSDQFLADSRPYGAIAVDFDLVPGMNTVRTPIPNRLRKFAIAPEPPVSKGD